MKVVIVGANFKNKGAQSMLFTTVATIRRNYPDAKIFFAHYNKSPCLNENFLFDEIYYNKTLFKISSNKITASLPSDVKWCSPQKTLQTIQSADLIIDINGFALGQKWGVKSSLDYLNKIKLARAFNVPIILMPQSFGPFDFGESQKLMDKEISETLTYPQKIFAREYDGLISLRKKYRLENVSLHPDLVLSSSNVKLTDIFKTAPKFSVPKVLPVSCVGVVPNLRSFDRSGRAWQTLQAFYEIINFLLKENKLVYLFRHSIEDITPCRWLKSLFADDERVILWENDFSCFEYDEVCRQFEFLIVGRFHGIVHAYRNNIPCLLMGWAVKYKELAQLMYQSQYIFDLAAPELDMRAIFSAIRDMENNLDLNKKILRERLLQVQQGCTCFSSAQEILDKVAGRRA